MRPVAPKLDFLRSPAIRHVVANFEAAVLSTGGVLICGERGTGREAMARAIHRATSDGAGNDLVDCLLASERTGDSSKPFVVLDCSVAADCEVLFGQCTAVGHDGIDRARVGSHLARALGGTLFLRQLQEMPMRLQVRLARVLRDGEVWVEEEGIPPALVSVQMRTIASIDRPQSGETDERLAPELQRRLAENEIHLPALKDRREDIPGLVRYLVEQICTSMNLPSKTASRQAIALLSSLPWRRNLRELRGLLQALILKVPGRLICLTDVLENITLDGSPATFAIGGTLKEAREQFEREYVAAVLQQHNGRMADAANALGIQRTNLYRKVRQLSVERPARSMRRYPPEP